MAGKFSSGAFLTRFYTQEQAEDGCYPEDANHQTVDFLFNGSL
jgi:hypothetical protein